MSADPRPYPASPFRAASGTRRARAWLLGWWMLLACCVTGMAHAGNTSSTGTSYVFDGRAVSPCSLSATTYTCASLPLTNGSDTMSIASGYTVKITSDTTFGYNQSLAMSGTATLSVTGNLDIGDIASNNLQISGGALATTGTFTVGAQNQTLTADITAAIASLGTGSTLTINGSVTTTGKIAVASHATINGALSGSIITTSSPVTLNGNVTGTTSFTLASGSTVTGNVTAPVVVMNPSGSTITGYVTAATSLRLGSSDYVYGDVTAGTLTTDSSAAIVYGNATVDSATLNWAGRVTKTIYCTGGTVDGQCDCVTNNSGYPVNTANGPTCASKQTLAPSGIDHFLITHDGTASACTPDSVTVTACTNAACTSKYTGGANVTVTPGGAGTVAIGATGTVQTTVSQSTVGAATLAVASSSVAAANATQCYNSIAGTNSCSLQFNGSVGLQVTVADHVAEDTPDVALVSAVYDANKNACGPGFVSQAKNIQFACGYSNPSTGAYPVRVSADGSTYFALNSANATGAACDAGGRILGVAFDANGKATLKMAYADVGAITLSALPSGSAASLTATDTIIVAPDSYKFMASPGATEIAGKAFSAAAAALNKLGNVAPNFGKESPAQGVTFYANAPCFNTTTFTPLPAVLKTTSGGTVTYDVAYPESGPFNFALKQANTNYLSGAIANGTMYYLGTATPTLCNASPRAYPAYFEVTMGVNRTAPGYYYSGQPLDVTVTTRNTAGAPTVNYDGKTYPVSWSANVRLSVIDPANTGKQSPALTPTTPIMIAKSAFVNGVGTVTVSANPAFTYTFNSSTTGPTPVTIRADENVTSNAVSSTATIGGTTYSKDAATVIRSGRIRIASRFGNATGNLALPVTFEYYTGLNWIRNVDENITIPASAIGIKVATGSAAAPANVNGALAFTQGAASLTLKPAGVGSANVVINLGTTATDASCVASMPATTGAALAWLRAPNGVCGTGVAGDPAGRATFGVFAPETRRIIHVREVFN